MASGDRIPGLQAGSAFPVSIKVNAVASSAYQGDGPDGQGLPKQIIDEVETYIAGTINKRASYYAEQYIVDGGQLGLTRDAWVTNRMNPWDAKVPVFVQAGSFTMPLPVDPETFRDTYQGYAPFTQTVGSNPFTFFDPKIGVHAIVGNQMKGLNYQGVAAQGHDRQSGLNSQGVDMMHSVQENMGPFAVSVYQYQGQRYLSDGLLDRFRRTGYGFVYNQWGSLSSENVLQTGWDGTCGTAGTGCASSGGFTQLRYQFNRRMYVSARYEGTSDTTGTFTRDTVALLGFAPAENARITAEDVIQHTPNTTHTMNLQYSVAY